MQDAHFSNNALADSPATAASNLSISRANLYKEIQAGRLKAKKIGARTLITRAAQLEWLNALPALEPNTEVGADGKQLSAMSEAELHEMIAVAKPIAGEIA